MQKVTIKVYAVSHKISIFNVMKMVKSGKLKSEVVEKNGKEIIYVILDEKIENEIKYGMVTVEKVDNKKLQDEIKMLTDEIKLLRVEIELLKRRYD